MQRGTFRQFFHGPLHSTTVTLSVVLWLVLVSGEVLGYVGEDVAELVPASSKKQSD